MILNRSTPHTRPSWLGRLGRFGLATLTATVGIAGISAGCLDRPVGEPDPETSNVFVKQTPTGQVDKIDMVFVIDNSLSMGDKQQVLAAAVPQLLGRLTNPDCVSTNDANLVVATPGSPSEECPAGSKKEFSPVKDIHIAIITSALGDNGGNYCPEYTADKPENIAQNDKGWLIGAFGPPRTERAFASPFLDWSASDVDTYGASIDTKKTEFRDLVTAAGELGCGLEMSLESWYRFLVDPAPPNGVDLKIPGDTRSNTVRSNINDPVNGVDQTLLAQRAQFLRPDSLLAVVMLSDENDCSLRDSGIAFLPATTAVMKRGTSVCDTNPNDPCCQSCYFDGQNGCAPDPMCAKETGGGTMALTDDYSGLRCWDQKRRFGYDFLMPIQRYVNALTKLEICTEETNFDLACAPATDVEAYAAQAPYRKPNPIFATPQGYDQTKLTGIERTNPDLVFVAGIVGVPWQDIATEASLAPGAELQYQLANAINWDLILPKLRDDGSVDDADVADDPHMIQSIVPRSGANPRPGVTAEIAGPDASRNADPIAMHEWYPTGDLEYACTFDLTQPLVAGGASAAKDCTDNCAEGDNVCARKLQSCSCTVKDDPATSRNPLCQDAAGNYGNVQYAAKAYPSLRELELLRQYSLQAMSPTKSNNAIVASICPKNLDITQQNTRGYGYNPAVRALVDRLKEKLGGTCLPRPLTANDDGSLPCSVIEVIPPGRAQCDCVANGRLVPGNELQTAVRRALKAGGLCDAGDRPACADECLCELQQLNNNDQCLNAPNIEKDAASPGYCYVDPSNGVGSMEVVTACPDTGKRMLRIVGSNLKPAPAPSSLIFIACAGSSYDK